MEEHRVHFTEIVKGALDGRNSLRRIREVTRFVRSCREAGTLRRAFLKRKLRRNWGCRIQVSQGRWIACERQESKPRSNIIHPSEEDRCQRSEDLVNSEVHRVRAQNLGARSCEKRSREVLRLHLRDTWQNHTVGLGSGSVGHTSDIQRSQHPIDLSRLGDSGEKGMKVQAFDSRSHE
jgi:hypothetical protein